MGLGKEGLMVCIYSIVNKAGDSSLWKIHFLNYIYI